MTARQLDLGAGTVRLAGCIRADISLHVAPDIVLDASRPLPFRDGAFDRVTAYDLVEHITDIPALMAELFRVLAPQGRLLITTPHFSCANSWTDPTHRHHFGLFSFDYFVEGHPLHYYTHARFHVARRVLRFHGGLIDALARRLAARWPRFYEHRLTWMLPAWYLEFELEAVKHGA